jgi:acyl-homoserine lactone acylase PvdQ
MFRRSLALAAFAAAALLAPLPAQAATAPPLGDYGTRLRNILPPGQDGGLPAGPHSTDQVKLYDGLTALYDRVKERDLLTRFKPARFGLAGQKAGTTVRPRAGLRIVRDKRFGVPHVFGKTRDDVMFGAGWVTAQDRGTFMEVVRGPARIAALEVPGINALSFATSLKQFEPSAQTESLLNGERAVLERFGSKGRRMIADVEAYVAGINAYYAKTGNKAKPWTFNDVAATASLIGAVFGRGGGNEVLSSQILATLRQRLGPEAGTAAWQDLRGLNDPESFATLRKTFSYPAAPKGATPGTAIADPGSFDTAAARALTASRATAPASMSNALLVASKRSATRHPLAVMGPQVGYYYPGFLLELDLHGGGIDARGAAFPGVSMYVLLGRGKDFAWSATSSSSDIVDQFLEELCNPDGSPATRASGHYRYKGECKAMTTVEAGTIKGQSGGADQPVSFKETVHGPVQGTVTVAGKPYAIALSRSTRLRDVAAARFFADLNANKVKDGKSFLTAANQMEMTFNWFYADNRDIAMFSSGRLPIRAPGADPSLPTLGTGEYDWRGWLPKAEHPQAVNPSSGFIVNWNNKPARGFGAADDNWAHQSVVRADLFGPLLETGKATLLDVVRTMNRAATEDLRAVGVWGAIAQVLETGPAPDERTQRAADLVSAWAKKGGSRLDRDLDGRIDEPGAAVLDAAWPRLANAVLEPALGDLVADGGLLTRMITRDNDPAHANGSAYNEGWYGYVEKDLRHLTGRSVSAPYSRKYCGNGDLAACRTALWGVLQQVSDALAAAQGPDPAKWRADARAERIDFTTGLLKDTMRWTNRPTFQQLVDFRSHRPR